MSARHLSQGSILPPFANKLRIYSMRFCPYAQRAHLVLLAKNIPHEVVNINLVSKPEWLISKSPFGKVPALEIEQDVTIYESLVTADYLDEKYPGAKLTSPDPLRKAQDRLIIEKYNKITTAYYTVLFSKDYDAAAVATSLFDGFQDLQDEISRRKTKFLGGATPGMVDYMIWPWFERLELMPKLSNNDLFIIDKERFSRLFSWIEAMKKDEAVKKHYLSGDIHLQFLKGSMAGKPDYDFLLN